MPRKRPFLPSAEELFSRPAPRWHALLSPISFANAMREPFNEAGEHGATINVHTGEFINVGEGEGFLVGGAKSPKTGRKTKGLTKPGLVSAGDNIEPSIKDIVAMREKVVKQHGSNPEAALGGWVDAVKDRKRGIPKVDLDASERITDPKEAKKAMEDRNEKAILHVPTGNSIPNKKYKEKKK